MQAAATLLNKKTLFIVQSLLFGLVFSHTQCTEISAKMAKIPHFFRRLRPRRRIHLKGNEALGSELSTLNSSRSCEVSAERGVSGFVPLRVGKERELFMVATGHINHPLMAVLLDLSAEELGFQQIGVLRVECDVLSFQRILCLIERESFK
jgi:hypothetical protein